MTDMPEERAFSPAQKSAARLAAVQALYQMELGMARPNTVICDFVEKRMPNDNELNLPDDFDTALFTAIVRAALQRKTDIEETLVASLDAKWPYARLEKILKSVLRAGAAELFEHASIDTGIIINDYVNVAHGFFAGKEPALVNAVLDRLAKTLRS